MQFLVLDEADRMLTDPTIQEDLTYILNEIKAVQEERRQTFLYSATMAKHFESLFPKELVFGKYLDDCKDFDIVEVGNSEMADTQFKKTVDNLSQKFALVPQNLKEAYLIQVLKTTLLKES